MTQITGKIYQMTNGKTGADLENRFPRTVMEAVLGLNSYLQDQFSSLADIYMPIEGIYEALTGQEFVFRKSPNTIKAKSLTIDRIKGRTLAWNSLVKNGNFATGDTNGWSAITSGTISVANNVLSYSWQSPYSNNGIQQVNCPIIASHKYYIAGTIKNTADAGRTYYIAFPYNPAFGVRDNFSAGQTTRIRGISTAPANSGGQGMNLTIYGNTNTQNSIEASNIVCIDLTLMFGAGNEPSTVEEFEALYPGYHDYSAGKLISNDAKQLETVGFNQWDEEWEIGSLDRNGQPAGTTDNIRAKNYIPAFGNTEYKISCLSASVSQFVTYFYDANKNMIPYTGTDAYQNGYNGSTGVFTTPSGTAYLRFRSTSVYGTTYNHDICINLSDESFNGQYEPYKKSTLPLNLDDFWVKDSQGNQVHITGGLKSAGSVKDEIVGNKYIKRVGSVDLGTLSYNKSSSNVFYSKIADAKGFGSSFITVLNLTHRRDGTINMYDSCIAFGYTNNYIYIRNDSSYSTLTPEQFKTAMNGVMLYYELATPIEYELVEPLIYTMKAGTTEARISPNSDGLSAPFCCDMTYSANENNDAGNAQYAATAGRLLNTHKIWGQDFNGSEDVDGNLVANGTIQGTQLKSTVATGTAPLTVASTTMVQNLVAEKASKLLTARTIWGRSFDGSDNISGAISNITTISASGLATISGGIALGTSTKAQAAKMVWDETNEAWHLQGNLYADGFITAGGLNESSPSVDISPYVIECNNWANSGRGYISQATLSEAVAKYKAGYQVHSNGYNTTNTYLLTGISETSLELYFNGDSGFTLSVEA